MTDDALLSEETPLTTLLVTHPSALEHDMGEGHPERPDRLRAIEHALGQERFQYLVREQARAATREQILRVHPADYYEVLRSAAPTEGHVDIDSDTSMNPGTWAAALHGAGAACLAVDAVFDKSAANVFVAMRPPGHHAERERPMGFCFFNNAAVAARHAQAVWGAERVAIMDFDLHHGNGTQDIFWGDPTVMYASTHEMPLYPGTGAKGETGEHDTIVNAPLAAGDGSEKFRQAMREVVLPRIEAFRPDLLVISAGFDAHHRDPLGNLQLTEADYAWATEEMMRMLARSGHHRIVSLLEGGYDLRGLSSSVAAHVGALMGA